MKHLFHRSLLLILLGSLTFSGCMSKKKYQELEESLANYEQQAKLLDSLRVRNDNLAREIQDVNNMYRASLHELENLTVANQSLKKAYEHQLQQTNRMMEQRKALLSTSSYEKQNLVQQLAGQQEALDERERELRRLEMELNQRRQNLPVMQQQNLQNDLAQRDLIIQQLQAQVRQKDAVIQQIKQKLTEAMRGFPQADFSVTEKRGKLYISMSQNLLFKSGSTRIEAEGKQALSQLAPVLQNHPDIDIMVEGHTDTDGSPQKNWELSTQRAISVVEELKEYGVDPYRMTAAGRAFYDPVASNDTKAGKALNRRTEIVISPNLDELMDLVSQ